MTVADSGSATVGQDPGHVECAGAVVHDACGRLLMVRRAHDPGAGLWSIPGGRVEPGERAEEAAAREVLEETGLRVEVGALLQTVTIGPLLVHDYSAVVVDGVLQAGDDALEARWCDVEDLRSLPLSAGLLAELERMGAVRRPAG